MEKEENVQKNENINKKSNARKNILITVFVILIISVIAVYVFMNMPQKQVEVYKEPEPVAIDIQNPIKILVTLKTDKVDIYNENILLKLPGINATVSGAKMLNEKILSDYSKVIEEVNKKTQYEISYEYTYNQELRYLILNITTKLSDTKTVKTYIYDTKQDKEVLLSELYTKYNFSIEKLKSRIKALNLITVDIANIEDKVLEGNIFLSNIDETKLVIGHVHNSNIINVTFNANEKNAEYIVMDSINVKEDKGKSTTGNYKLYTNIKLPKIKLETTNANLLNNKINNIYNEIQNYYVVEENVQTEEDTTNAQSQNVTVIKKELLNSYETNYRYGYITELGYVYITITKNTISGKDDERSGEKQKVETEYISYVYNVSEDKEEDITKLFELFGTSKEDIVRKIIDSNSEERTNIEKASENISNFSIESLTNKKFVVKLKVDANFYEVMFER